MRGSPRLPLSARLSPEVNTRSWPCPTPMSRMIANRRGRRRSVDVLRKLAGTVALRHLFQGHRLKPGSLSGASELLVAQLAQMLGRFARRLQEVARVELGRVLGQVLARGRRHREPDVGIDVDLA